MPHEPIDPELSTYEVWRRAGTNEHRTLEAYQKIVRYLSEEAQRHPRFAALRGELEPGELANEVIARGLTDSRLKNGDFQSRGVGSLRVYLRTFLDSIICDHLRRRMSVKRNGGQAVLSLDDVTPSGEALVQPASPDPTPTGIAVAGELAESLASCLEGRERDVWLLRVRDEHPFSEIANRLEMTESAARSLFNRIVRRLGVDGK